MPQMGETVTEGTITAWLKAPGDPIAVDESLLEISTDKVDSEIPSPVAGVVAELLVPEGDTVPIGQLLARITTDGAAQTPEVDEQGAEDEEPASTRRSEAEQLAPSAPSAEPAERTRSDVTTFLSPVVRRLVDEHELDPAAIDGSGRDGRITRDDVLALVEAAPPATDRPGVRPVPFTAIRRTIGRNLVSSLATAAHTLVVVEVDFARVEPVKERTGLTWLPFIARAVIDAVADFPLLNAHVTPEGLDVHDAVHLGVAVDLDFEGLVVPVVRDANDLRLAALAAALKESAAAAREHRLAADDYAGGQVNFMVESTGRLLRTPPPSGANLLLVGHRTPLEMVTKQRFPDTVLPEGAMAVFAPTGNEARLLGTLTAEELIAVSFAR